MGEEGRAMGEGALDNGEKTEGQWGKGRQWENEGWQCGKGGRGANADSRRQYGSCSQRCGRGISDASLKLTPDHISYSHDTHRQPNLSELMGQWPRHGSVQGRRQVNPQSSMLNELGKC